MIATFHLTKAPVVVEEVVKGATKNDPVKIPKIKNESVRSTKKATKTNKFVGGGNCFCLAKNWNRFIKMITNVLHYNFH